MESVRAQQDVDATADVVWSVLQDGAQYCTWVPGVGDVEGDVQDGESITLVSAEGAERTSVKIGAHANRRQMTWRTGAGLGLDRSEVAFDVADTGFGCTVVLTRTDAGLLHGVLGNDDEDPKAGLQELAAALAAAGEARAARRETRSSVDQDSDGD